MVRVNTIRSVRDYLTPRLHRGGDAHAHIPGRRHRAAFPHPSQLPGRQPLSLRIAPELYLKRCIVGGLEKVYEINRNFRNEGISYKHNPEFTMLEFYWAYVDYLDLMDFLEEMISSLDTDITGSPSSNTRDRPWISPPPWRRVSMLEAVSQALGQQVGFETGLEELRPAGGSEQYPRRRIGARARSYRTLRETGEKPALATHHRHRLSPRGLPWPACTGTILS